MSGLIQQSKLIDQPPLKDPESCKPNKRDYQRSFAVGLCLVASIVMLMSKTRSDPVRLIFRKTKCPPASVPCDIVSCNLKGLPVHKRSPCIALKKI